MIFSGATFKTGLVTASKPGWARVRFDDLDGLDSAWLPVVHPFAFADKAVHTLKVDAQVACLLDQQFEDGVVLGGLYSDVDVPPTDDASIDVREYEDGTRIVYDKRAHRLTVEIDGCTVMISSAGVHVSGGDVVADGISLKGHKHVGVRRGSETTDSPS